MASFEEINRAILETNIVMLNTIYPGRLYIPRYVPIGHPLLNHLLIQISNGYVLCINDAYRCSRQFSNNNNEMF